MQLAYDRKKSVGHLTGLANRLTSNLLGKRFREAGIDLTAEQWGALLVLLNGGALTQQQLGALLYLEKSSVSRLVDGLERRGWVARAQAPGDGRNKLVTLTSKALAVVDRCTNIASFALEEAQRGMSEEERLACQSFLLRIIENLEMA